MSRLEELIQELCPDGVEYKELSDAVRIMRGKRVVRRQLLDEGRYPVFQNSLTPLGYYNECNCSADTAYIIVAGAAGEIGYSYVDFWAADDCFYFRGEPDVQSRYLYHVLLQQQPILYAKVRKASIPRLSRTAIEKLKIPVPPLEIQCEIVRILDNFTELTAELTTELTAELTARRKQYSFYRNKLLSFKEEEIRISKLGDVCDLKAGKAISAISISDNRTDEYAVPCYGGNGLRGYVKEPNQSGDKSIIGRQGALCGNVCYATGEYYATEHAVVISNKGAFNNRFLFHLLVSKDLNQYKTAGAQPGLSVARLNDVSVPVPKMEIQDRIANVLDNFDAICGDLNIGLPAEIEARRKQYEYYRDLLLTFAESGSTVLTDRQT